jgi:hypothetical protein
MRTAYGSSVVAASAIEYSHTWNCVNFMPCVTGSMGRPERA